jgi:hypothetical protein
MYVTKQSVIQSYHGQIMKIKEFYLFVRCILEYPK